MYYTKGVFGVLNLESLSDEPMVLLDGGIESRYKEDYFFDNSCRSNYHGYLFQYTLVNLLDLETTNLIFLFTFSFYHFTNHHIIAKIIVHFNINSLAFFMSEQGFSDW